MMEQQQQLQQPQQIIDDVDYKVQKLTALNYFKEKHNAGELDLSNTNKKTKKPFLLSMLKKYPWRGLNLNQIKYILKNFIQSLDLSQEVGTVMLDSSVECKNAGFSKKSILRILCLTHSKLESVRYEGEIAELIPTELNNFLLRQKSEFIHSMDEKPSENMKDTILPTSLLFPSNDEKFTYLIDGDIDKLKGLEDFIDNTLFPLVFNFWIKVVTLEISVIEENNGGSIKEISEYESSLLLLINSYVSDKNSIMFRQFYENTCMKKLLAEISPELLFTSNSANHQIIKDCHHGNSENFMKFFLDMFIESFFTEYKYFLTSIKRPVIMNPSALIDIHEHHDMDDLPVGLYEDHKEHIKNTTCYLAGSAVIHTINSIADDVVKNKLISSLIITLDQGKLSDMPVRLFLDANNRNKTCPCLEVYEIMERIEFEIFTPLLSQVLIISIYRNKILDRIKKLIKSNNAYIDFINLVTRILMVDSNYSKDVLYEKVKNIVNKFFKYYLNTVAKDYERFITRRLKDALDPTMILGFRRNILLLASKNV